MSQWRILSSALIHESPSAQHFVALMNEQAQPFDYSMIGLQRIMMYARGMISPHGNPSLAIAPDGSIHTSLMSVCLWIDRNARGAM